jgi:hypothetical protein
MRRGRQAFSVTYPPRGSLSTRADGQFPYGYNYVPFDKLPPLCPLGQFCPDEGDQCLPKVPVGQQCQKDRDGGCSTALLIAVKPITDVYADADPQTSVSPRQTNAHWPAG